MQVQNVTVYATQLVSDCPTQKPRYLMVFQLKWLLSKRKLVWAPSRFMPMTISVTLLRTQWLRLKLRQVYGIKSTQAQLTLELGNVQATLRQKRFCLTYTCIMGFRSMRAKQRSSRQLQITLAKPLAMLCHLTRQSLATMDSLMNQEST